MLGGSVPLGGHVLNHDGGFSDDIGCFFRVLNLSVFFVVGAHDVVHCISSCVENILKFDYIPFSCTHPKNLRSTPSKQMQKGRRGKKDHSKIDMNASFCPIITHQLKNLKQLLQMQILLTRNNINHLIKMILVETLFRSAEIPCQIQTRSIPFPNQWLGKLVLFQIDQKSTLVLRHKFLFLEHLVCMGNGRREDLRFAGIHVVFNVQSCVRLCVLCNGDIPESLPEFERRRFTFDDT
jgi:hypothetical protein